jgi:hypothetical protein
VFAVASATSAAGSLALARRAEARARLDAVAPMIDADSRDQKLKY